MPGAGEIVTSLILSPAGGVKLNKEIMLLYWLAKPKAASGWAAPRTVTVGLTSPWVELRNVSVRTEILPGKPEKDSPLLQSPALLFRSKIGLLLTNGSCLNCMTLPEAL